MERNSITQWILWTVIAVGTLTTLACGKRDVDPEAESKEKFRQNLQGVWADTECQVIDDQNSRRSIITFGETTLTHGAQVFRDNECFQLKNVEQNELGMATYRVVTATGPNNGRIKHQVSSVQAVSDGDEIGATWDVSINGQLVMLSYTELARKGTGRILGDELKSFPQLKYERVGDSFAANEKLISDDGLFKAGSYHQAAQVTEDGRLIPERLIRLDRRIVYIYEIFSATDMRVTAFNYRVGEKAITFERVYFSSTCPAYNSIDRKDLWLGSWNVETADSGLAISRAQASADSTYPAGHVEILFTASEEDIARITKMNQICEPVPLETVPVETVPAPEVEPKDEALESRPIPVPIAVPVNEGTPVTGGVAESPPAS